MRMTKIICTIGPVSDSYDMLEKMYHAGMNVVRLNMSHGDHQSHAKVIKAIQTLNKKVKYPVPVLLDTQGPEIRTGELSQELSLVKGEKVTISVRSNEPVEETSFQVNYEDLINDVQIGDRITVDNGLINLDVLSKNERTMECLVVDGGQLGSRRHVNLPGIRVNLPAITEKDKRDIQFAIEQEVDYIALSFVRSANDIAELKVLLGDKADKIKIIAKIEDQEGVKNLEAIAQASDGVMVARGDLGVEVNAEDLPIIQRNIVRTCARLGRRVIVATHLLESMIENPMPTRAEVTDVANAVYEGVDAVMLSGETTVGKYPLKCLDYLDRISKASEQEEGFGFSDLLESETIKQDLANSACMLADATNASAIVVITRRGRMANFVTNRRPATPIIAFSNDSRTRRQLALNRNTCAYRIDFSLDPEKTLANAFAILKDREGFDDQAEVVVVSDILEGTGVDAIQMRTLNNVNEKKQ